MSDPKFYMTQPILSSNPISHRVQSPSFNLGPPDPTVIAFIAWLTCSTFSPRWEQFSLSSARHASFNVWHRSFLWQTRLPPEMPPIFRWFWSVGPAYRFLALFPRFYLFFTWPGAGAFPSLRFLIVHQKWPQFSDLDSLFASLRHCAVSMGQQSACFDRGSSLFRAGCNCNCPEVLPDSSLFTIFWNLT